MTPRHALAALLAFAWILPGLVGHDPWKPDEAYTFGVVYELLKSGNWLVPHLAGAPFFNTPPLLHYTAAATAGLLHPLLPLHDAARIATGLYMGFTFLFCGLAGRELHGRGTGTIAMLLLLGTFGLVVRSHQLITDVAALAGFAIVYYGCALAPRSRWAAIGIGTGIGVVFLAEGILEAMLAAAIPLLLPLIHSAWRSRQYAAVLLLAALVASPWLAVWPSLLAIREPALFTAWLAADRVMQTPDMTQPVFYTGLLPWYGWPLWALAFWGLWRSAKENQFTPGVALPLLGVIVTLGVLSVSPDKGEVQALPILVPLALLAAPAVASLRRGASYGWYWFSVMGFTFFIVVAWFYWTALELGMPARLHAHLHRIQPGYTPGLRWLPFLIGVFYTLAWFAVLARLKRSAERPAIVWATGVTVLWALLAVLFIGWIDTGKSYRGMIANLQRSLPQQYRCMAAIGVGDSQRAMLHYFANIVPRRDADRRASSECDLLLVQGRPGSEQRPPGAWRKIWEGNRPGDKAERFRLYRRAPPESAQ